MDFIEPCFGIGHNLSLICQMTSEDIKHQLIIIMSVRIDPASRCAPLAAPTKARRSQTVVGTRPPSAPSGCSYEGSPITNSGGNPASQCALWLLLLRPADHSLWSPSSPSSSYTHTTFLHISFNIHIDLKSSFPSSSGFFSACVSIQPCFPLLVELTSGFP